MKRPRGACKGCKCLSEAEQDQPYYICMAKEYPHSKIRKPPKTCDKRIDAETYMNGEENECQT